MCHYMVADVAQAAAERLYEAVMGNNTVREVWKKQNPGATETVLVKRFVDKNWPKCIEFAKQTMVAMLRMDSVEQGMKDKIVEALIKDSEVSGTRMPGRMTIQ